jgi:hypothetical protein
VASENLPPPPPPTEVIAVLNATDELPPFVPVSTLVPPAPPNPTVTAKVVAVTVTLDSADESAPEVPSEVR